MFLMKLLNFHQEREVVSDAVDPTTEEMKELILKDFMMHDKKEHEDKDRWRWGATRSTRTTLKYMWPTKKMEVYSQLS